MTDSWDIMVEPSGAESPGEGLLGALLDQSHHAVPAEIPDLVNRAAAKVGIRDTVIYLIDYEQVALLPLAGREVPERESLVVDQTLGGRAYRSAATLASDNAEGGTRVWLPLINGTARQGVLEAVVDDLGPATGRRCRQLTALVATLIVSKDLYADTFAVARRTKPLALAAEMQWELLPPLSFSDGRVTVSGALEPSYRIAGDTFDYATEDRDAHITVIDAMGHGFEAAIMSSVAVNVYRHCRRHGHTLADTYAAMSDTIAEQFGDDCFATGQLAYLDASTGVLRWVNAGHPPPLLIRDASIIGQLECAPSLPLGLGDEVEEVAEFSLEPGDRVLFLSDGVLEARSSGGEFFGEGQLPEFVTRAFATDLPLAEILRRLARAVVEHHERDLQDDATTVCLEWAGRERQDPYSGLH